MSPPSGPPWNVVRGPCRVHAVTFFIWPPPSKISWPPLKFFWPPLVVRKSSKNVREQFWIMGILKRTQHTLDILFRCLCNNCCLLNYFNYIFYSKIQVMYVHLNVPQRWWWWWWGDRHILALGGEWEMGRGGEVVCFCFFASLGKYWGIVFFIFHIFEFHGYFWSSKSDKSGLFFAEGGISFVQNCPSH